MSSSFLEKEDVQILQSNAYACRCGMIFFEFFTQFNDTESRFFEFLMKKYPNSNLSQIEACSEAERIFLNIRPDVKTRSVNDNLYMAFLSLVKIGVILNVFSDEDNDTQVDEGFNACNEDSIESQYIAKVGVSLAHVSMSFSAVQDQLLEKSRENLDKPIDLIQESCKTIDEIFTSIEGIEEESVNSDATEESEDYNIGEPPIDLNTDSDTCILNNTDEESYTSDSLQVKALRTLLHEGVNVGLGSCGNREWVDCLCL